MVLSPSASQEDALHEPQLVARLIQRLAETEAALQAIIHGQVDAVLDPISATPVLLRQAQEALRVSEARYRRLIEQMGALVFELDADGTILFVNENVSRITGSAAEDLLGQNWWEIFGPIPQEAQLEARGDPAQMNGVVRYELDLHARNGASVTLECVSISHYDAAGRLGRTVGFGLDITARKRVEDAQIQVSQAQAARAKAEARRQRQVSFLAEVSSVLASSLDYEMTLQQVARLAIPMLGDYCVIDTLDEDQQVRRMALAHVNPEQEALAAEIQRCYPSNLGHPGVYGTALRQGQAVFVSQVTDAMLTAVAADDEHLRMLRAFSLRTYAVVPLVVKQRVLGIIAVGITDSDRGYTTEHQQLIEEFARRTALAVENARLYEEARKALAREQAARASAEAAAVRTTRLQSITAAFAQMLTPQQVAEVLVEQGCVATDAIAGVLVLRNADGETLEVMHTAGYPPEMMAGWTQIAPATVSPVADAARSGKVIWVASRDDLAQRYPHLVREAWTHTHQAWVALPLWADEQLLGAVGWCFAEMKPFVADDRDFMISLTQQCVQALERAWLYEAEQQARSEAEAAVRVRDEVLSIVSHDLKNPLTVIKGRVTLLGRRVGALSPDYVEVFGQGLRYIGEAATRMISQINETLDVARLQTGEPLDLHRQPTDLVALVQRLVDEHQQSTAHQEIRMSNDVAELVGDWDAVRLERVIANLLSNAVKYSPRESTITVEVSRQEDDVGAWAVVEVQDQGVGIPASELPRIFDMFHRAHNVAGQIHGSGLGLASALQIVEQHNGTLTVASEEGVGSTFRVRLPLSIEC